MCYRARRKQPTEQTAMETMSTLLAFSCSNEPKEKRANSLLVCVVVSINVSRLNLLMQPNQTCSFNHVLILFLSPALMKAFLSVQRCHNAHVRRKCARVDRFEI